MSRRNAIILLIVILSIGFAAVSTTLIINGNVLFGIKEGDFDVYFSEALLDTEDVSSKVISTDGKTITYETKNLEIEGDNSILDYTVVNNSSHYDAAVSVNCELEENEYILVSNSLQEVLIPAKSEKEGKLTVTLNKTSVEEYTLGMTCTIEAKAVERESIENEPIIEGESSTYSLYGYLVDDKEEILPNVLVYISTKYETTGKDGYIYLEGIESGSHTIYIINDKTKEEIQELSEEEIKEIAITSVGITTSSLNIVFPNGYKIVDSVIEKTKRLTITLDGNGVELETKEKEVTKGLEYGELPEISKEGYNFLGWYDEEDKKVEETTKVTKDINHTLTAKWSANTYTITFNPNGVELETKEKEVTYGEEYGELPTATRTGYTFTGWYTAKTDGTKVESTTIVKNVDEHTLYARWSAHTYTVAYNANGGSGTMASVTHTYGEAKNLTANTFTRTGYTFNGWNTKTDGTGTSYSNSASVCNLTSTNGATVTLYAKWTANTYTLTANANSGTIPTTTGWTGTGTTSTKTVTYDGTYGTLPTPTRTGYVFLNWQDGSGNTITSTTKVSTASNHTITAQWENDVVEITFNGNGGTPSATAKIVTYDKTYGELATATRTGYTFSGWWTAASGGTQVTSTTSVTNASNHTLYAHWTANTYTVTFNSNSGTISSGTSWTGSGTTATKSVTYASTYGTLPTASRTGYTFAGWYTATSGGSQVTDSTTVSITAGQTLYARWTANTYTVTANANSGTIATTTGWSGTGTSATKSVTFASTYGTLPSISRTGYTLKGWYTAASGGTAVTTTTTVSTASNHTIYAQWTANTYTVAYNANGGSGTMASVSHTYDVAKNLTANTFTRTGYTFNGWNTKSDGTGTTYANSVSVTNLTATNEGTVTLYAQWKANSYTVTANSNSGTISSTSGWSGTGTSATKSVTFAGTYGTLPSVSRTGYTLKGWYTAASGGTAVTTTTTVSTAGSHTIYAQWTANTYTVAYNANGGSGTMSSVTHTYDVAKNLTANTFTRSGYEFTGWNTVANGSGTSYANGASVTNLTSTSGGTVTLYAQWKEKIVTVESGTGSSIGDILSIGDEQFYVISNDGTNIKMLAKYNLYVGGEVSVSWTTLTTYTEYENPTGIQDSTMIGYTSSGYPYKGTTAFGSSSTYSGSIVEGYVNNYSNYLKNTYGVENTATLMSTTETTALGCVSSGMSCIGAPIWLYSTSYWTRTVANDSRVWYVSSDGSWMAGSIDSKTAYGVRPLITISASLI